MRTKRPDRRWGTNSAGRRLDREIRAPRPERDPSSQATSPASTRLDQRLLFSLTGLLGLTFKRLIHRPGVTLLSLLGLVLSVGLISSAGFFAQAVDKAILQGEFLAFTRVTGRPAFSTRVYTFPSPSQPLLLEGAEAVAQTVAGILSREVGLPITHIGLRADSNQVPLLPAQEKGAYEAGRELRKVGLVYVADVAPQMDILAGEPLSAPPSAVGLDVWMHTALAEKMGVQLGDQFQVVMREHDPPLPVHVAGLWRARAPSDVFWFSDPDAALAEALLVRREDFLQDVQPYLPFGPRYLAWDIILDEKAVIPAHAARYLAGFGRALRVINQYLPDALLINPENTLSTFVERRTALTLLLLQFYTPAFCFLLSFLVLMSAVISRWQRREISILVSRGASSTNILTLVFFEEALLFLVAGPLGIAMGMWLGNLMGATRSFLSFQAEQRLPVSLYGADPSLILAALGVALVARLWPAAQQARRSIVSEEREVARSIRQPFWFRFYLDFLLVIPTIYAYQQLGARGAFALLGGPGRAEDLYQDPLLIIVPALFILTAALLAMRVFPLLMRAADFVTTLTPWNVPYLATHQLSRHSQSYVSPLLLVIVALGMGVYTLCMAQSLDEWLIDRFYYQVGADISFEPFRSPEEVAGLDASQWIPPPEDFRALPGIIAATRVRTFPAQLDVSSRVPGHFMVIDRADFPQVGWFRPDLAAQSLGTLMNQLGTYRDGILLPEDFLQANGIQIGERLSMEVASGYTFATRATFQVVGSYRHFPTVQEGEITAIGNMEYVAELFGGNFEHLIWLRASEDTEVSALLRSLPQTMGIESMHRQDTRAMIRQEQGKMERVGVFGSLSISFLASAAMGAIGLLVYGYAALGARLYQFAVLRAIGLEGRQVVAQVVAEYATLTAYGTIGGALIGSAAARLFVPFLQPFGAQGVVLPPLLPIIPEGDIRVLLVAFVVSMVLTEIVVMTAALGRRLFRLLRLGQGN